MSLLVSNIQRMCMHDGPGLRTTVFLKGCSIKCPWCANPENISFKKQYYFDEFKCRRDNNNCVYNSDCIMLKQDSNVLFDKVVGEKFNCPINAIGVYGSDMSVDEVYNEVIKDKKFWVNNGGVTFSGGEPLMQADSLIDLMKKLKNENIHIAIETAMFASKEAVEKLMEYVDLFIIDVKILEGNKCKEILKGNVEQYIQNINLVSSAKKNVLFRVPCSDEYTLTERNMKLLIEYFSQYKKYSIQIFKIHRLAQKKYETLGKCMDEKNSCDRLEIFYNALKENGNDVSIINI